MEILFSNQDDITKEALWEMVNPVYKTAKTTLFALADSGDEDAKKLCEKLSLTEESATTSDRSGINKKSNLVSDLVVNTRYSTIGKLAMEAAAETVVDLPCGYTPRGVQFARKNQRYIGLDLPATISESEPLMMSLIDEDKKDLVRYISCDATNYSSLSKALSDVKGKVCICTEGILMYLTDSETSQLCDNICRILKSHGGCWLLADTEVSLQYGLTIRSLFPEMLESIRSSGQKNVEDRAEIRMGRTDLLVNPAGDVAENIKTAMTFLARHGLKAERLSIAENMPELAAEKKLSEEQRAAFRAAMAHCAFWKITAAVSGGGEEKQTEGENFSVKMQRQGDELQVNLTGRVDTLTAPEILSLYEQMNKDTEVSRVNVDCSDLVYISSAGLRVLLIIHKRAKECVKLTNVCADVAEILAQTGFDSILQID